MGPMGKPYYTVRCLGSPDSAFMAQGFNAEGSGIVQEDAEPELNPLNPKSRNRI